MTTGSIPTSCLTSPKSSKGRRGSAQPQPQQQPRAAAERRWRFTSDELARIQEQLDEVLMHSNPNSRSTPSEPHNTVSPFSNSKEVCFRHLVILSLLQAGCPAACQPAVRCPMCPALGVPRRGTAPGSAASGPGSSSAYRCRHRTHKRTYLRHKHARSPAYIHVCAHACVCLWLSTPHPHPPSFSGIDVKPGCTFECFGFWVLFLFGNHTFLKIYTVLKTLPKTVG